MFGTFPKAFSQGPSTAARIGCGPNAVAKKDLGSCRWEIAHLRSCTLGQYPWEVATWENPLGKYLISRIYKF